MSKNPIGPDGLPMEKHHPGRLKEPTELIPKTIHDLIHEDERNAVRDIFRKDGLTGIRSARRLVESPARTARTRTNGCP